MLKLLFSKRESTDSAELLALVQIKVDHNLGTVIRHFQNMTVEALLRPSPNGGWSIAQCLEHLNYYSRYYLPAIEDALAKHKAGQTSVAYTNSRFGQIFTNLMKPESNIKMKATGANQPDHNLDAHAVVAEFIAHQEHLLHILKRANQYSLAKIRVPISISKIVRLPLGDVFQFLTAHEERHILQAMRLIG